MHHSCAVDVIFSFAGRGWDDILLCCDNITYVKSWILSIKIYVIGISLHCAHIECGMGCILTKV